MADVQPYYGFLQQAGGLDREDFLAFHEAPFLHFHNLVDLAASAVFTTLRFTPSSAPPADISQQGILAIRKGELNAFSMWITLGRAKNNDLIVSETNVSKFHAWFNQNATGVWTITDAGSTNGTRVEGHKLEPKRPHTLRSGAKLVFADCLEATFLSPAELYEQVQAAKAWAC